MVRHGYPVGFAAALQATAAELGVIIPPSIPMILYGVAAEVSIGELFIAGLGPGILIGVSLLAFVWLWCRWRGYGVNDHQGPAAFRGGHAPGRVGVADAGHHPWRHLRRHLHTNGGFGRRGVLCPRS
jgi:hypothetical protein